jgi:predicted Zn-dependent peptidase
MSVPNISFQYMQLSQNFRLITNSVDQSGVKISLHLTAGGAFFEREGQKGMTHLLEHCMVARTRNRDFKELQNWLFEKNINMNAFTGRIGMEIVASGHRRDIDEIIDLVLEFGFNPYLSKDILKQEKAVVLREISQYSGGAGYRLNMTLIQSLYKEGSYSLVEVLGKSDDVKAATLADLHENLSRVHTMSNFVLTVSGGGINEDKICNKLHSFVEQFPADNSLVVNYTPKNYLRDFTILPVISELGHQHAVLNIIIPCEITFDNRAVRAYLRELLFENPIGALFDTLRNRLGYIYSLRYSFDLATSALNLEMTCEVENIESILSEVRIVFESPERVVTPEKVEIIRNLLMTRKEIFHDNPQFFVDFTMNILIDYGVIMYYDDFVKLLENVQQEEILAYYAQIAKSISDMKVVVVSNNPSIKKLVQTNTDLF